MNVREIFDACFSTCFKTFGETILYETKDKKTQSMQGIFTNVFTEVETGGDTVIASSHPAVEIRFKDLGRLPLQGEKVQIRGTWYRITEVRPNTEQDSVLVLKKV